MFATFARKLLDELEVPAHDRSLWLHEEKLTIPLFENNCGVEVTPLTEGASEEGLLLFHTLGLFEEVAASRREEFTLHLMEGNLFGQGTLGATLGLSATAKQLTLSLPLPYTMHYIRFRDCLEGFVNIAHYWREELSLYRAEAQK